MMVQSPDRFAWPVGVRWYAKAVRSDGKSRYRLRVVAIAVLVMMPLIDVSIAGYMATHPGTEVNARVVSCQGRPSNGYKGLGTSDWDCRGIWVDRRGENTAPMLGVSPRDINKTLPALYDGNVLDADTRWRHVTMPVIIGGAFGFIASLVPGLIMLMAAIVWVPRRPNCRRVRRQRG
jgi:hypothetical protein